MSREMDLYFERNDVTKFRITLCLQPSGDVLVECRGFGVFLTGYEDVIMRNRCITNRMCAGVEFLNLFTEELVKIKRGCNTLRRDSVDSWDSKYAPGPEFTGG